MIRLSRVKHLSPNTSLPSLLVVCLCVLMSTCVSSPTEKRSLDEILSAADSGVPGAEGSAEYYIQLANESSGEERQQYLLKAAELLYQRGDLVSAQTQLQNLQPGELAQQRQQDIQLLAARIAVASNNPSQALELIPADELLSFEQQIEARMIRADVEFASGYFMRAARARIALDPQITLDETRERNHQGIWRALSAMPDLNIKTPATDNVITQGWLDLARIMRTAQTDMRHLQEAVLDWGTRYPQHPVSNAFIDTMLNEYLQNHAPASGIAVLLPMSGSLQTTTEAIQNGFISAYYQDRSRGLSGAVEPVIRFYDSGDETTDFMQIYQQAIFEGAHTVVGPLDKAVVNMLAQQSELEVPVLTLNYAENPLSNASNLYQFGLLPEDEARQAAELAVRQNKLRAAVLVPNSEWGQRIASAFAQRFTELGGIVLISQQYAADKDDYSWPIRRMFNLNESDDRRQSIEHLLSKDVKFVPHRRQDVDMIFLAATPRAARSIMPAFKFHHAGGLPVYSTSHVYSGHVDPKADRDLNGIIFCDLPWNLVSDNPLKDTFADNWPEHKAYTRLFALGVDAWHLLQNLAYLSNYNYARFSGETGNIHLGTNNRLHRELVWAQFKRGVPVYLDTTVPTEPVIERENDDS
jgi:hypothetical protein